MKKTLIFVLASILTSPLTVSSAERVKFNNPGLKSDLGVGLWAWPLPMDWDGDGDLDLVVSCPDVPYNGTYFFENPDGNVKMPVFKKAVRVGGGMRNVQVSYVNGTPRVLVAGKYKPAKKWIDFLGKGFGRSRGIGAPKLDAGPGRIRAKQWKYVDFDGDGSLDLSFGAGAWGDYGWDNAFDAKGNWTRGPLHGRVFIIPNKGTSDKPEYGNPFRVQAGGKAVDVFGMPSPNFADFDGDGDLDLVCGEFLDGFTYFRNVGSRKEPKYDDGVYLEYDGEKVAMHVQMVTPTAIDWDRDGDVDLVCGDEDGRVALVENTGKQEEGIPVFKQPAYFKQAADDLKFGALVTPFSFDWDGDGDEDLICGNTSGNIGFFENLDGGSPPKWANPVLLKAGGKTIRIQAGPNGSIQGPCEAQWGYTTLYVADWDHDGLPDLVVNSIWGKVVWYRNTGARKVPELAEAAPIKVEWTGKPPRPSWNWWDPKGKELATQWRTTPCVADWDKDGLNDLVMLDHEGYLAWFRRRRKGDRLVLNPGRRIFQGGTFDNKGNAKGAAGLLQLNNRSAGGSGRRKLCIVDWDRDGRPDLLVNSKSINFLRNMGEKDGKVVFADKGKLTKRRLAGHTTSPTTVDWDRDGVRDLLIGAEDGRFYLVKHPKNMKEKP